MNENIDLTKILKDCPKETKLYSSLCGEVYFKEIRSDYKHSIITTSDNCNITFTKEGRVDEDGECLLFPDKEQRDWSKFTAPWYKKEKFDPNTLKPFDKALARAASDDEWIVTLCGFKYYTIDGLLSCFSCVNGAIFIYCIPYNEETKHLIGTTEEAPEYYRYWED